MCSWVKRWLLEFNTKKMQGHTLWTQQPQPTVTYDPKPWESPHTGACSGRERPWSCCRLPAEIQLPLTEDLSQC